MKNKLIGKNFLIISPLFHGYENEIISELERRGAIITFFQANPPSLFFSNPFLARIYNFLFNDKKRRLINHNNDFIWRKINNEIVFDFILIIKGDYVLRSLLVKLRNKFNQARFILYLWDSLKNCAETNVLDIYNDIFSFDYEDCKNNISFHYLPMFCLSGFGDIFNLKNREILINHEIFSMATYTPYRFYFFKLISRYCIKENISFKLNIKAGTSLFLKNKISNSGIHCFYFDKNYNDYKYDYLNSKAILDISSLTQTGLSPRIIEAVVAGKKIITTNKFIVNETFYNDANIFILTEENITGLKDFLAKPLIPYFNVDKYKINNFIDTLFIR